MQFVSAIYACLTAGHPVNIMMDRHRWHKSLSARRPCSAGELRGLLSAQLFFYICPFDITCHQASLTFHCFWNIWPKCVAFQALMTLICSMTCRVCEVRLPDAFLIYSDEVQRTFSGEHRASYWRGLMAALQYRRNSHNFLKLRLNKNIHFLLSLFP